MIPLPKGISRDDVGQWLYSGICLARHPSDGKFEPAVMDRVYMEEYPEREEARVRFNRDGYTQEYIVPLSDLRAHWPLCGSVNITKHKLAIHVERTPARQYRRTFNSRQVVITTPRPWELRRKLGSEVVADCRNCTTSVITALFHPTYPSGVDEAMRMLADGWFSVAVNPRVIIVGDDVGKRLVYYRGKLAATMTGGMLAPVADELTCKLIARVFGGRYEWI